MKHYYEVRHSLRRYGKIQFATKEELSQHIGFQSAFGFDRDVMEICQKENSLKPLKALPVYCDTLLMDFDSNDEAASKFELDKLVGINYQKFHSGNRSIHFHIKIFPIIDNSVPMRIKQWVKKHAPEADLSFYHHGGLYRLPGTIHDKTSKPKVELNSINAGNGVIYIPHLELCEFVENRNQNNTALQQWVGQLLMMPEGDDGRHPTLFKVASCSARSRISLDKTIESCLSWNKLVCTRPLDEAEVEQYVRRVYQSALKV